MKGTVDHHALMRVGRYVYDLLVQRKDHRSIGDMPSCPLCEEDSPDRGQESDKRVKVPL